MCFIAHVQECVLKNVWSLKNGKNDLLSPLHHKQLSIFVSH